MPKRASAVLIVACVLVARAVDSAKPPTVAISILVRNKAHTLPYFLSSLENLNYPKDRLALWVRSDHNVDNSVEILKLWVENVHEKYHSVNTKFVDDNHFQDEEGPAHWSPKRFDHVISLRESGLEYSRKIWADYALSLDADVFLTNPDTLRLLISKNATVVAPMLRAVGLYSNFWAGMTDNYYYLRTDDYEPLLKREKKGCFRVPMVHSCVLVDLRRSGSDLLTYSSRSVPGYDGPRDDIITFALSANRSGVELTLCNDRVFGFIMTPLEQDDQLEYDHQQLVDLKLEVLVEHAPLPVSALLGAYTSLPPKDTLGFDRVFMINLLRRPDRRKRMKNCFDELGLEVEIVDAVDGKSLNGSVLREINFLPGYEDPYHKRPMTFGEIGCFLSHYNIWRKTAQEGYEVVLVLEDDVRFEPFFRAKVEYLLEDLRRLGEWDLVYFGRKRLLEADEPWVEGSEMLVKVGYSYWTLGYALSRSGAQKLLAADPLSRMLPVDEYLPILFDKHPEARWKGHFPKRDLRAYSAAPLLLYPTHYTGEKGYISDTEDSGTLAKPQPLRVDL